MIINDEAKAKQFLQYNNYYKFAGYWKKFAEEGTHVLTHEDNSFDFFYELYMNDRNLSRIILKYICMIEDALKTQYAYNFSINTGNSHPHLDKENFKPNKYDDLKVYFLQAFNSNANSHAYKSHYLNKYLEELPPIWVLVESLTLGTLINAIEKTKDEKIYPLYEKYNYKKSLLRNFLSSLFFVRNQCAHNSILWNMNYSQLPSLPENLTQGILSKLNRERPKIIINFIIILYYLLKQIKIEENMKEEINSYFLTIESKYLKGYGIISGDPLL